jgi:UBX domain-containing protein 1/4
MAGLSLRCGDCGAQLRSVEEAQAHAESTNHANFVESTEAVLNLVCSNCGKPCRSHTVRSHHPSLSSSP